MKEMCTITIPVVILLKYIHSSVAGKLGREGVVMLLCPVVVTVLLLLQAPTASSERWRPSRRAWRMMTVSLQWQINSQAVLRYLQGL